MDKTFITYDMNAITLQFDQMRPSFIMDLIEILQRDLMLEESQLNAMGTTMGLAELYAQLKATHGLDND